MASPVVSLLLMLGNTDDPRSLVFFSSIGFSWDGLFSSSVGRFLVNESTVYALFSLLILLLLFSKIILRKGLCL